MRQRYTVKKRDFAFTADVVITVPSAVVAALGPSGRADADKVHDALWETLVAWCEAHGATFGGGTDVRELDGNGDPLPEPTAVVDDAEVELAVPDQGATERASA